MKKLKSIRETFLPDPGEIIIKADLSQAEDRTAKMECNDDELMRQANCRPWEFDAHRNNARLIFGHERNDQVTNHERQLGKKTVHGYWRGMAASRLAENILVDSGGEIVLTTEYAQKLLDAFGAAMPAIKGYYMPSIEKELRDTGRLVNAFGRIWDCRDMPIDADLLREAYSFKPQSCVADHINKNGLVPLYWYMMENFGKPPLLHKHDELIVSVPIESCYDVCLFIQECLETPFEIPAKSGRWLSIPATFEISDTFYGGKEFEEIPNRKEFYEKIETQIEEVKRRSKCV